MQSIMSMTEWTSAILDLVMRSIIQHPKDISHSHPSGWARGCQIDLTGQPDLTPRVFAHRYDRPLLSKHNPCSYFLSEEHITDHFESLMELVHK